MSDKKKGAEPKTYKFDTLSLHAGYQPHKNAGSRQVPIYQTTSYLFDDVDHAAALFNLERGGHIYSRISNPTVAVLEERVAALEGGTAALATSSGMSAIFLTIMTLCQAGDHLVVSSQLYGGTVNLFRLTLPKFGIKCTFVKPRDTEGFKKAIQDNTKGIFGELVGNPGNELMNMPEIAKIAHEAGIPLMVDATYQTPYLCKPIEHGADIVVHSLTKWMAGHGSSMAGILVEGGKFDWMQNDKFPTMTTPYEGYHGLSFAEEFGPTAFTMKARAEGMRDFGPCLSPQNAWNVLQGIETLSVRMERHCENAKVIATFLDNHNKVDKVYWPGFENHLNHDVAKSQMSDYGGMISFTLKGDFELVKKITSSFKVFTLAESLGGVESLVNHPATMTHASIPKEERDKIGIADNLIRLSVGIEDISDLVDDIKQAIN